MKTITFRRNLAIGLLILFAGVFGAPRNGLANLDDSLVAYWNFDEGSGDTLHSSIGGYNGTIYGATWASGISGSALYFDADAERVEFSSPVLNTPPYTFCAWVKALPLTSSSRYILANGGETGDSYGIVMLIQDNNQFEIGCKDATGYGGANFLPPSTDWTYLCGVWDGTYGNDKVKLYLNGSLAATANTAHSDAGDPLNMVIGSNSVSPTIAGWRGLIDEVRIYDRALSAEEIQMLYNAGTGLVGYWNFDECSGDTVHDHSGHNNHGTIDGASWTTGVSGCALEIVGTNIVHHIPRSYDDSITSALTVTAWIKWYGLNPDLRASYIFDGRGYEYPLGFLFGVYPDSTLNFSMQQGSGSEIQSISHVPADTSWTHVAVVFDDTSNTLRVFINGVQDNTLTTTATYYNSNAPLAIGNNMWEDGNYRPLNGVIDEARIYNRALSADEIEALYCGRSYIPRGDANSDGEINLGDVVYLITYLFKGGPPPDPLPAGDVNCDCVVDIGDVVYLITYLYKSGPPPFLCSNNSPESSRGLLQSLNKTAKTASVGLGQMKRATDDLFEIPLEGKVDMEVAGLQFDISYDPKEVTLLEPALTSRTEGLQVFSNIKDGIQRIGIVDLSGQNYVPAGESPLIVIRGRGTDLSSIKIKEAILVDKDANKIPVEIVSEMKKGEESSDVKESIVPKDFSLSQNLPNPFNPETEISYDLPNACHVSLSIYNLLGQRTRTLVDEYLTTGHKTIRWDGRDDQGIQVASGIYFYQIQAGDFTDAKKMILMK